MGKIPRKTFEIVFRRLALPLTKFIVKRVGGNQEAVDEVLSRTMIAAWKSWGKFEHKSSYFTWLCRIALNKAADYYREEVHRNSKFIAPILENLAHYDSRELTPEQWYELNELCNSVKSCIKLLPQEKQKLLFMRYWKGMAIKEIAKTLGISERAVEGKIYRAKVNLRKIVGESNPELELLYSKDK